MVADALYLQACRSRRRIQFMSIRLPTRPVGRTKLSVPELGFGAAPLGNLYGAMSDEDARDTALAAIQGGITYFDTAPYYGFGLSEQRVGDAVRGHKSIVISTKIGRLLIPDSTMQESGGRHGFHSPMPFQPVYDYSFDGVMTSWRASKQRLGLARIDILYVHDIGRMTHGNQHEASFRQLTSGGGFRALEELRSSDEISAFGLGVNETAICLDAMEHADLDVILLAGRYTLLEQDALNDLLPECARTRTSIVVGGPYNSGILATGTRLGDTHYNYDTAPPEIIDRVRRIEGHCDRFQIPLAAAALQFPLANPVVASVIPGLGNPYHVEQALDLYRRSIPGEFWHDLKSDGLLHVDAPVPMCITAAGPPEHIP
jgi:D-threo-aldose 1-dehydrogenase